MECDDPAGQCLFYVDDALVGAAFPMEALVFLFFDEWAVYEYVYEWKAWEGLDFFP